MALINKPFTFINGTIADANEVNANFDALYNLVNGNLDGSNIGNQVLGGNDLLDDSIGFDKLDWGDGENQINGTETDEWILSKDNNFEFRISHENLTDTREWVHPDSDDVYVGEETAQTLSNKTLEEALVRDGTIEGSRLNDVSVNNSNIQNSTITDANIIDPVLSRPAINDLSRVPGVPPIGSIIPFYDYDFNLGFDADYWKYCDGSNHDFGPGVGIQQLPDLSGRYLVGFGSDGGSNLDSALWNINPVGIPDHEIDLSHSHTVNAHSHTGPLHSHDEGTLRFEVMRIREEGRPQGTEALYAFEGNNGGIGELNLRYVLVPLGVPIDEDRLRQDYGLPFAGNNTLAFVRNTVNGAVFYTNNGRGHTGEAGNDATSVSSPGTNSRLSNTQSIQPRSVRVRYLMRVR